MQWSKEQIDKVRNISIAETMGVSSGRRKSIQCPMPNHNDSTPSFLIDLDNGYHCFGCKAHGQGFIDFLEDMGYSFEEIMNEYGG